MVARKRAPARSKTTKKPVAQRARALRGESSLALRETILDSRRIDWGGKQIGLTKRQRAPASMEMNRRYRAGRKTVDSFHPTEYATGELEAIARGRTCEAWTFVMHRNDVPKAAREMAVQELARRAAARGR